MNRCPPLDDLQRLLDEELSGRDDGTISTHVEKCHDCQGRLERLTVCKQPVPNTVLTDSQRNGSDKETSHFLARLQNTPPVPRSVVPPADGGTHRPHIDGYEILGELGRGGMGVVYQARQRGLDRLVALKVILEGQHASAEIQSRFRREAAAVARLRHPNVVQIHEISDHDGRLFFSMEHVTGGSLARWLAGTPQNPRVSAHFVELVARAVQAAHDEGIVHRDLKPANILLSFSRERQASADADPALAWRSRLNEATPKITDFGLAKIITADDPSIGTHTGAIIGSPSYMAPEQAQGNPREIGPAADIYALGAILYEMLTGRPPFRAETPVETVIQVLHGEVIPPRRLQPKLSRDLETICLQCLRKDANQRYATAAALADDLRRFQSDEPIHARPIASWRRGVKWARRRPALAALIGVSLAATVALLAGGIWYNARLQAEVARTKDQQIRAAGNLQTAIDVLEHQLNELQAARQRGQSVPPEMNQSLLERSIPFFESLLAEKDYSDPTARRAIGRAHAGLARTYRMTKDWDRAETHSQHAIEAQEQLMAESPDEVAYRIDLAQTLNDRALLHHMRNQQSESDSTTVRMALLVKSLSPEEPRLGNVAALIARQLFAENKLREAVPWLNRHIRETERILAQSQPGLTRDFTRGVLQSLNIVKAELLGSLDELPQALETWDKAIAIGDVPKAALGLTYCRGHRACVLMRLGRYRDAIREVLQAIAEGTMKGKRSVAISGP